MRIRRGLWLLLGSLLCGATTARAQDNPKLGVTMESPTTAGVIWHVFDVVAIQSEIGFSTSSSDGRSASDQTSISTGVGARLYLHRWDNLRAYASPRYSYSRSTQHAGSS